MKRLNSVDCGVYPILSKRPKFVSYGFHLKAFEKSLKPLAPHCTIIMISIAKKFQKHWAQRDFFFSETFSNTYF